MADKEPIRDRAGHEKRDINVGRVALVGVLLLGVIAIVGHFVPWFVFDFMAMRTGGEGPAPSPLVLGADQTPPPPRLQARPQADLAAMRTAEENRLKTYSWADRATGVVRIPVDRAMSLLAERGIGTPQTDQPSGNAPAPAGQGAAPGAAASGQTPARK